MKTAYILASYRTPGCRANKGNFKDMRPDDLAAIAIKGLLERTGIEPITVDDVYLGRLTPALDVDGDTFPEDWDAFCIAQSEPPM